MRDCLRQGNSFYSSLFIILDLGRGGGGISKTEKDRGRRPVSEANKGTREMHSYARIRMIRPRISFIRIFCIPAAWIWKCNVDKEGERKRHGDKKNVYRVFPAKLIENLTFYLISFLFKIQPLRAEKSATKFDDPEVKFWAIRNRKTRAYTFFISFYSICIVAQQNFSISKRIDNWMAISVRIRVYYDTFTYKNASICKRKSRGTITRHS